MANPNVIAQFDEIYDSTYKSVLSYITAKCRSAADIEDIVQETYMELYRLLNRRGTDYIRNNNALLLKIARQKLFRHYSVMQRLRMFVPMLSANEAGDEMPLSDFQAEAFSPETFSMESFSTEDFTVNQMLIEDVRRILRQKPEDVKKIFNLFYDADLTIPEIAKALSMSESAVKNKLYRTLKALREQLK